MVISIKESKIVNDAFIRYVIRQMRIYGMAILDAQPKRLLALDNYFNEVFIDSKKKTSTRRLVILGLKNIVYRKVDNVFEIEINPNIKIPYFNNDYLTKYCNLIDKGNLTLHGTYIFTKVFNYAKNTLHSFVFMYAIQGGDKRRK